MKKKPTVTLRGRGIVIQLRDTLAPNTTYSLNFGSAIRDNNEGNPLYSMRYVFSTGPEIDSMLLTGYTADSYKADSVSKTFIWFFPADSVENVAEYDSTVFKYKPASIARAENNGIFIAPEPQNRSPTGPMPSRIRTTTRCTIRAATRWASSKKTYNPAEMPDFAMWYDSDPPVRDCRAAALFPDVHRQGVPPADAFGVRASPAAQGDALYFASAHPEDHRPAFRQHPRRPGHLRSPDRGPRYDRPVVQRPSADLPDPYDQG